MLIFSKGHSHIKQDDLSAYLDGQISEADAARIDQRLAQCADCRQDLDALRSTVSLLQRMPEITLPRSFVMPGPPPALMAIRPPAPLRMPQWVYSGAAATAVLVLAILISADATGLLTPNLPARTLESTAAAAAVPAPQAAPEIFQGDGTEAAVEMAAPLEPVAELAVTAEKVLSVTVTKESEVSEAIAKAPTLRKSEAAPQAAAALEAPDDSQAAAPVAAMAEAQIAEAANAESVPPPPIAGLAYAEAEAVAETKATPPPAVSDLTTPDKPSEPALALQERSSAIPPAYNPITLWRVLEGLTAIVALTFLVMWLLRRRTKR